MKKLINCDEIYFKALDLQEKKDYKGALRLLRQGSSLGDSGAQHAIGVAYDSGLGVEKDKQKAILWFKKAWRTGRQTFYCSAVALTYAELDQRRRALYWWQKAIALGDGGAALALAKFLLETNQSRVNRQAINLLRQAANSKDPLEISCDEKEEAQDLLQKLA